MNPLQQIPARIRNALYWTGYILGVLGQGITIVWGAVAVSSPDVSMPLWLVIVSAVVGLAQTQLNLLAGANVGKAGAVDLGTVDLGAHAKELERLTAAVTGARPIMVYEAHSAQATADEIARIQRTTGE